MKIANRIRGKQNAKTGIFGEAMAERWLWSQGFKCVSSIETGWRIRRVNGKIVGAKQKVKVAGDFTAMTKTGRFVFAEVKVRGSGKLLFSDLEKHQVEALDERVKYGALCLLIWIMSPTELKALQWPIAGFKKNNSLRWDNIK